VLLRAEGMRLNARSCQGRNEELPHMKTSTLLL